VKFCHVTTFFGSESFGGDAAYVDRLSRALLRQGHQVDVVYCGASFDALRGGVAPRSYNPPAGLTTHVLPAPGGSLSLLYTHQTGRMGLRRVHLQRLLDRGGYDVIHYHNISLIGGAGMLSLRPSTSSQAPVTLMTAHEYWLVCPLSLLWKFDSEPCRKTECVSCTIRAGRPPQLWRAIDPACNSALSRVDAALFPSRHALEAHSMRGVAHPRLRRLPYFLPADWAGSSQGKQPPSAQPYFAAAGRLVKEKGFQTIFPLMKHFPGVELRIAGDGPYAPELRRQAGPFPNITFTGPLASASLASFFGGAVAAIVPSLFEETFGYVVIEALSTGTPVIAHRRGALPEVLESAGGAGLTYDSEDGLHQAMKTLLNTPVLRRDMGERGRAAVEREWNEAAHLENYFEILGECRSAHR
jgi:glycosyltransferase involved in cell wall biosynthesis